MTKLSTLGFIKNGEKYKVLAQMPATYPASRVMMENGDSVEEAIVIPTGNLTVSGVWSTVQVNGTNVATIPLKDANKYTISVSVCATFNGSSAITTAVTIAEKRPYGLVLTSSTGSIGGCHFEAILSIS